MYCAIDVETTRRKGGEVIALGAVLIDKNLNILDSFYEKCRPQSRIYWDEGSEKIHNIKWEEALDFQPPRRCVINFMNFLSPSSKSFPLWFVYHALFGFDFVCVENLFREVGLLESYYKAFSDYRKISTVNMARQFVNDVDNYKLNTLSDRFGIKLDHHNALSDAKACAELFIILKKMEKDDGSFFKLCKDVS